MYPLNKILVLSFLCLIFIGCEDNLSPNEGDQVLCGADLVRVDGKCTCTENTYTSPFVGGDGDWCIPLSDSFYIRIGHEGDISNFEIMSVLKFPTAEPTDPFFEAVTGEFPDKFIVEIFPSNQHDVFPQNYLKPYISVIAENANPSGLDFPIVGGKEYGDPPLYYRGPKDINSIFYGVNYEWNFEFQEDSATVNVDVYSIDEESDSIYLDDEITMYFERYRE